MEEAKKSTDADDIIPGPNESIANNSSSLPIADNNDLAVEKNDLEISLTKLVNKDEDPDNIKTNSTTTIAIAITETTTPTTDTLTEVAKTTPKPQRQTARQRTPVVRIQHQYSEMYDPVNNMGSSRKRKSNSNDVNSSSSSSNININNTNSSGSNNPTSSNVALESRLSKRPKKPKHSPKNHTSNKKRPSSTSTSADETMNYSSNNINSANNDTSDSSKSVSQNQQVTATDIASTSFTPRSSSLLSSSNTACSNNANNEPRLYRRRPPSYRWIGKSLVQKDTNNEYYEQLEIKFGNHASLISIGDTVLLCSGDMEEDELYGGPLLPLTTTSIMNEDSFPNDQNRGKNDQRKEMEQLKGNQDNEWDQILLESNNSNFPKKKEETINFHDSGKEETVTDENDSILGLVAGDIAINALDPFVARIEAMWEEHPAIDKTNTQSTNNKNSKKQKTEKSQPEPDMIYPDERRTRMKFRARWYFKKEDVGSLGGNFSGVSRERVLATMSHRDVILGDQTDDNEVATILGKCLVLRRKIKDKKEDESLPKGAFVCRYDLKIQPANSRSNSSSGAVLITPYEGEDEDDPRTALFDEKTDRAEENEESIIPEEKAESDDTNKNNIIKTSADQQLRPLPSTLVIPSDANLSSLEDDADKTSDEKYIENVSLLSEDVGSDENSSLAGKQHHRSKKPPTSEGSVTHGKIHVGEQHQAIIPPAISKREEYCPSRNTNPTLVWKPNNVLSEGQVDNYMLKVAKILESYMNSKGIQPTLNHFFASSSNQSILETNKDNLPPCGNENFEVKHCSALKMFHRECEVDKIISLLNEQNFDIPKAIQKLETSPTQYLKIWTKQEKELFNAGFRRYCGSLRMITRGIGPTKNNKDVVDYHYRYKIPSQYLRYQEKKREQARRMLEFVDKKLFEDVLSKNVLGSNSNTKANQGGVPGNGVTSKKIRSWSTSGGTGKELVGATEKRRVLAKEYLMYTRDVIGPDKYNELASYLKLFHSRELDIILLKKKVGDILGNFPTLHSKFLEFLPKKLRT